MGFPFNICTMAEDSDFKFGTRLGFAKAHHKITLGGKSGRGLGQGKLAKFRSSTSIFTQWLKLGTSNLVHSLYLPRSSPKFWGSPLIFVNWLKLATSNLARSWGWPSVTTKTITRGKSGRGLELRKLPNIWGFPLIFLQRPPCPLRISGASFPQNTNDHKSNVKPLCHLLVCGDFR